MTEQSPEVLTPVFGFLNSIVKEPKDFVALLIALWGAILSTLLAAVKGFELWRDRHRTEIEPRLTSSPQEGNEIRVRNLWSRPLIVSHWKLCYSKGLWPFRTEEEISSAEFDAQDLKIEPNSSYSFRFVDEDYFSTSPKALKGRNIVFTLHVAGMKSIRQVICKS